MTMEEALARYLVDRDIIEPDRGHEDWYDGRWFYLDVRGRKVPFFPEPEWLKPGLYLHDVNHLVSGYDTTWRGECEEAAWELGSGGCGRYLGFWLDRIFFIPFGLVSAPIRTLKAFFKGLACRNLYRFDHDTVLASEVEDVRHYVHFETATLGA